MAKKSESDPRYARFPLSGPVREYRPYILAEALKYKRKYNLDYYDVVAEALQIALAAEKKFDPAKAKSFGTLLFWELKGLTRWCKNEYRARVPRHAGEKPTRQEREDWRALKISWHGTSRGAWRKPNKVKNYSCWKEAQAEQLPALAEAAKRQHNRLKNEKQRAVLDWMIGDLTGRETRTMMQAAIDTGITRGYASKIVCEIARNIKLS